MLIIPLQAVPSQAATVSLDGQACQVDVWQTDFGLFITLYKDNAPVVTGVICQNRNRIVRDLYFGFSGDLAFIDTQGSADPIYTGLGSQGVGRFLLAYLTAAELDGAG